MSLDAQLKARAEREIDNAVSHCRDTLDRHGAEIGISGTDLARLISGHKIDTLKATVIKARATTIGETLMGQLDAHLDQ